MILTVNKQLRKYDRFIEYLVSKIEVHTILDFHQNDFILRDTYDIPSNSIKTYKHA